MKRSLGFATVVLILAISLPSYGSQPQVFPNGQKYRDAGVQPATGRSGNALLQVQALRGKAKTDVTVTSTDLSGTPAGTLQKVQVKFFGNQQQVTVNDNYRGDALHGDTATFSYESAVRGQHLQAQANVGGIDAPRTDVVTVDGTVALRPDLAVLSVTAPAKAFTNQQVTITALVAELNGDTGAHANCNLSVDGVPVDSAESIWVDAGDSVTCEFTYAFASTGVKQLSVGLTNVDPADYDDSNNQASTQIEIVDPSVPVAYNLTASDEDTATHNGTTTHYTWTAIGAGSSYVYDYTDNEDTLVHSVQYQAVLDFPRPVKFPVVVQSSGASDGQTFISTSFTLNASSSYSGAGSSTTCGSSYQAARWFKVCTYSVTSNGQVRQWTDVQTGTRSGTVTFYSNISSTTLFDTGVKNVYSYNSTSTFNNGYQPTPSLGNHVDVRASVADASATYNVAAGVDLFAVDVTSAPPQSCTSWDILYSYAHSVGYSCTDSSLHLYGTAGSATGTAQQ